MVIAEVIRTPKFEDAVTKVKDTLLKERVKKQIQKIIENPEIGKPLRYDFKGSRSVRIKPFRIIYSFQESKLYLLRFEHREDAHD